MTNTAEHVAGSIGRSVQALGGLAAQGKAIGAMCDAIVAALRSGRKLLTCGHGGSAADALHMAEELVGRFEADRVALPALALVADPTALTCIANDFGFDRLFSRQIEAHGQAGDVLVVFSTSGKSPSLKLAVEQARQRSMLVVTFLGKGGGPLAGLADHEIIVASDETARIQEAHTLLLHIVLEAVERAFA